MNEEIERIKKRELESSNKELRRRIEKLEKKLELKKVNDSKFEKIKKRTLELLELSTSHGIPNIVRANSSFILVMWSCLTIASTCLCSYFEMKAIFDYLKFTTITNIQVIHEQQAQFPTISFCASPSFNITLDQIFIFSRFDNIIETNFSHYFEEFTDVQMGKCFRYNSGKNIHNQSFDIRYSTMSGFQHGLKIDLKLKIPDEYDFVEVYLFIHNHTMPIFDTLKSTGYWLSPGSWNYFEIDRLFHQKLDAPYSDCLKDVNLFKMNKTLIDFFHKANRTYTQDDCYYKCSHLFALEESKCGCNSTLNDFSDCIANIEVLSQNSVQKCISDYLK